MNDTNILNDFELSSVSGGKGGAKYVVDPAKCAGCGKCKKNCPAGAITLTGGVSSINQVKCAHCGTCFKGCPKKAISKT